VYEAWRRFAEPRGARTSVLGTVAYATWEFAHKRLLGSLLARLLADPDGGLRRRDDAWLDAINADLSGGAMILCPGFDFSRSQRSFGRILEQAWKSGTRA
jgi:hypothetical protein